MKWKIFCILGILAFAPCAVMWAVADDDIEEEYDEDEDYEDEDEEESETPSAEGRVVARLTCDTVKAKISELQVQVVANPDLQSELDDMIKKQRGLCARSSRARPVRNFNNLGPVAVEEEVIEDEEEVVEEKPKKKKKKNKEAKAKTTETPEEKTEEKPVKSQKEIDDERAANLANGLCPDGAKPNKFGCCEGEKFKDLGNLNFACCAKDDEKNCHNPIKK